jgi:ribulose-5-phosphate 4-epimerase/fuculose-1-phosphate aldolase
MTVSAMQQAAGSGKGSSIKDQVSPEEWKVRVDLAAFYRLVAKHDMDDLVGTHISARVPGEPNHFLLNPYGLLFEEITASSLVKVNMDGEVVMQGEGNFPVNAAGFTIHSAVQGARPDVVCAAHTHTVPGMALSALGGELAPMHQKAMRFYKRTSYHDYEGVATDLDERERLVRDLGENNAMVLRNHGLLVCGASVRSAWALLYNMEKCCAVQLAIEATGAEVIMPSEDLAESTYHQFAKMMRSKGSPLDGWESALRLLDREDPTYKH